MCVPSACTPGRRESAVASSAPAALVAATVPPAAFEYGDEGFGFRCAGCSGCASESCCLECSSAGFGFCRARCNGHASRSSHRCCPGRCSFCSSLACFSCSCTCCCQWQWRWCCRLPSSASVRARRQERWPLLPQPWWRRGIPTPSPTTLSTWPLSPSPDPSECACV